ncbi:tetratricopeptide repeat protein [Occallatibacter riparius]|uniref:Tetratricopeptide repeat protein n=1 Tax=Occallatibacter riparius TaxID=1002689 RepID=A0A9J7BTA9_9BACT|nr:tetratricopeptide repeat protein [Occallatibacter riparius]UWZ84245.1 tetratricopeptide repeat protein [Occallatibacter riparius]
MSIHFPHRFRPVWRLVVLALLMVPALCPAFQANPQATDAGAGRGRILLVLPFDNNSGQPSLEWIREGASQILGSRFLSAGFAPLSRADRLYALDHLGLPAGFQPSHASSLKIAQTLDADSIIVGSFRTEGSRIETEAQIISVPRLKMSEPVTAGGEMRDLVAVFDSLAWKLTKQLDPAFSVAQETFVAAGANVHLQAFEQYIRGITEPDQDERLRHLQQAVKLNPDFSEAWMALARADYAGQRYEQAAAAFAKVKTNDAESLEAGFYRGLALMFSGDYAKAETAFAGVARVLPLAPVLNNQGVAVSRQGHDGTALFRQAEGADPAAADYHFNLAVSLNRHGDKGAAQAELAQYLKARPNDSEAQQIQSAWKGASSTSTVEPLERIVRGFDAVAFRQAAVMLDQMEATRLAALPPAQRAQTLAVQARDYLSRGLLLESERLYQQAIAQDNRSQAAHAGLAEVRERTGDAAGARKEAQASLELQPTVDAYLILARLDLAANQLEQAGHNADEALKLNPNSQAAKELLRQLSAKQGATKQQTP